jgi:hypothetical protein
VSGAGAGCRAGELRVSLRECRLLVERALLVAGAPRGSVASAVDLVVAAQAAGVPALSSLVEESAASGLEEGPLRLDNGPDGQVFADVAGGSALLALGAVLDVAQMLEGEGGGPVVLTNARHVPLAAGLEVLAARRGRRLVGVGFAGGEEFVVGEAGEPARQRLRAALPDGAGEGLGSFAAAVYPANEPPASALARLAGDSATAAVIENQMCVPEQTWWELFELSNRALTPASERSRRDTGIVPEAERSGEIVDAY